MESVRVAGAHLQELFWKSVEQGARKYVEKVANQMMKEEQLLFLGCLPYERCAQRRGQRNGYEHRFLDTRLGTVQLAVPKTRNTATPFRTVVFDRYRRQLDRLGAAVRQLVALGGSTRRIARLLRDLLGSVLSAQSISRLVSQLDAEVAAFHRRPLGGRYRTVYLDGKHAKACVAAGRRRRGRGKMQSRVLLLAWGVTHQGREELIDYRVVPSEGQEHWEAFLSDLEARGLRREPAEEQTLQVLVSDEDGGLEAARLTVYPGVPHQLCVFHKLQNIAEHLEDRSHREAIMAEAAAIYRELRTVPQARQRLRSWRQHWLPREPEAVRCFCADFETTLVYLSLPEKEWSRIRTTNPLERFIKELNRKINQVGVFPSDRSWDRMTYLSWCYLQSGGYPNPPQHHFTRNS